MTCLGSCVIFVSIIKMFRSVILFRRYLFEGLFYCLQLTSETLGEAIPYKNQQIAPRDWLEK